MRWGIVVASLAGELARFDSRRARCEFQDGLSALAIARTLDQLTGSVRRSKACLGLSELVHAVDDHG
jgi:hypothetical protein